MFKINDIKNSPNKLAQHYTKFGVSERLLFTGHSHQAWLDIAFDAQMLAIEHAAKYVDNKWEIAFEKAEYLKQHIRFLINDRSGNIALAPNTHDLILRFLSALPLKDKPKILTTAGEFHTIRRQLDRLSEENITIDKVDVSNFYDIPELIINKIDESYSAVMISAVFFQNAGILQNLSEIADKCNELNIPLLVDAYHAINVIPFDMEKLHLQTAFVVGGGYKYLQFGEGNCFMRFPANCKMRPVITGWFSEFSTIGDKKSNQVAYGQGDDLFAGSTYDPTSHYRAAATAEFFNQNELTPEFLREISLHQVGLIRKLFLEADLNTKIADFNREISPEHIAGFFTVKTPHSAELNKLLFERDIFTDYRGDSLRFGPAPYISDLQIENMMDIFIEIINKK